MKKSNTNLPNINPEQMFSFLVENGIIDVGDTVNAMIKKRKENILKKHTFDIWKGNDGRYRTYIEDET